MAKNEISDYDETNANNTDISGIAVSNSSLIAQIDDIVRAQMGALKRWFRADLFRLRDSTDQTKLLAFGLSGLTTATTRTLTVQDKNGTIALTSDVAAKNDARRNRLVNPAMQISQENGNTAGTGNNYYASDCWLTGRVTSAGTITSQRVQSTTPNGAKDRYRVTVTVADAALAAGEYLAITQNIEGNEIADFRFGAASAAQSVLRFGFKGPAGTYSIHLGNAAANRSYIKTFTISAGSANTDTVQTFAIPGDITGTWITDTGIGLVLDVVFACGSTFQGTDGAWQAGNLIGTSGNSNGMATAGAVFELFDTGLYLDAVVSGTAPAWELPKYADEELKCQRYLPAFRSNGITDYLATGQCVSTTVVAFTIPLKVPPRVPLTGIIVSSSGHFSATSAAGSSIAATGVAWAAQSLNAPLITVTVAAGLVAGNASQAFFSNASGYLLFTGARL